MKKILLTFVVAALIAAALYIKGETPLTVERLSVEEVEVEAEVFKLKLVAKHNGDQSTRLSYRVISGDGEVANYNGQFFYFEPARKGDAVVEVTAINGKGEHTTATWRYVSKPTEVIKGLYTDEKVWKKAATKPRNSPALTFQKHDPNLKNVLLIGTSISIGYTPHVQEAMGGKEANIYRIPENSLSTTYALQQLDYWLSDMEWDVIHINLGLHDLKYVMSQEQQDVPPTEYRDNLRIIFERLSKRSKKVIWATTTFYPDGVSPRRDFGDDALYNQIAAEVLRDFPKIKVDDQYTLSFENQDLMQNVNVHFKVEGYKFLSDQVCKYIREALK
ncbi:MAG: SGNH/GDSL hydrolase family protein [Rikenellaceae bacterium]